MKERCLEIGKRNENMFFEIGIENDHAHFLNQFVPIYNAKKIIQTVKRNKEKKIFERAPKVNKKL